MPSYDFKCLKCSVYYEDLTEHDPTGKYPNTVCPKCGSKRKEKIFLRPPGAVFANPKESSKWENEGYRWGHNKEKASKERRDAVEKSHMGANPYPDLE